MPEWIHNRAEHLLAKNPSMNKSTAFAIATQQSHALGKSPKGYGTLKGRSEAKGKYDTPKDDKKTANPGALESPKMGSAKFPFKVVVETTDQGASDLPKLLSRMQQLGQSGHTYGVLSDDRPPVNLGEWDGDGAMGIGEITVERDEKALKERKENEEKNRLAFRNRLNELSSAEMEPKSAGIAVSYDLEGNPVAAETSDEWLASHFRDVGAFKIPSSLMKSAVQFQQSKCASRDAMWNAFECELGWMAAQELSKTAMSPNVARSLIGGGVGAGLGAGAGYLGTLASESADADTSNAGRNALLGALAGAGLGVGGASQVNKVKSKADDAEAVYQTIQSIQKAKSGIPGLKPTSLRANVGQAPGVLAQKGIEQRKALALQHLSPGDPLIEAAAQGKFGAAVSPEEAAEALNRYQKLQDQKPTAGQIGRYAAIGAVATPAVGSLRNVITGGGPWHGGKVPGGGLRSLAGQAIGGAILSGAVPLVRSHLDRQAEVGKLKRFVQQNTPTTTDIKQTTELPAGELQSTGPVVGESKVGGAGYEGGMSASEYSTPIEGPKRARQASSIPAGHLKVGGTGYEGGMTTSEYSGPLGYGGFPQASYQGGSPTQDLQGKPFERPPQQINTGPIPTVKTAIAIRPAGMLASSMKVGKTPGAFSTKGPSIAQVAKPKGYGLPAVGAIKS